jgi:hypothetical protein
MEDGGKAPASLGTLRAVLAILQWWGFNVTVIIINKWIFQVSSSHPHSMDSSFPIHLPSPPRIWMPDASIALLPNDSFLLSNI